MRLRQLFAVSVISSLAVVALGAAAACSSSSSSAPDTQGGSEAGAETGNNQEAAADVQVTNPNEAKQKGRIVDAISKFGVTAPVITIAGKSVTGKDDGNYEIIVPKNVPYQMSVTAAEHYKLIEQEWIVKTDAFDRTDTSMLGTSIANILATLLVAPRDATKGFLVVRIYPLPPCTSEQDATISISPAGASKITYFKKGQPDKTATSTTKDETFSAAFEDVDPGAVIHVSVNSPTCEQVPFPVDYQNVTYTGVTKTEPGDVLSYIRVFIGPKKIVDGGGD